MRYYDGSPCRQIGLTELLRLVRTGQIYSLSIEKEDTWWVIRGEVVVRGEGIKKLKLMNHGHGLFHSPEEPTKLLLQHLSPPPSARTDWHLADPASEGEILCGVSPVLAGTARNIAEPEDFFDENVRLGGSRCGRCKTQAYSTGYNCNFSNTAADSK